MPDERRALLKLLARFELTADQARRWYLAEEREEAGIDVKDGAILVNPYLCYELDREQPDPIALKVVDRGLYPEARVSAAAPIPEPSRCAEAIDPRRGRALFVAALEQATGEGHTLLPQNRLVRDAGAMDVSPKFSVGGDWVAAFKDSFEPELEAAKMADGAPAWQLDRYAGFRSLISVRVKRRLSGARHTGEHDWRALIDATLHGVLPMSDTEKDALARTEKAHALRELFQSRLSVFVGPAGTGKTSLLDALISMPEVKRGGVLLLAPTGKARVQIQRRAAGAAAYTLAQFLLEKDRYDTRTGAYKVTNQPGRENAYETVIVDEASMLTEDQLASTIDALEPSKVQRLILVGDPRQLPPIGAGRPFVDIIRFLREHDGSSEISGLAELKIVCRQGHDEAGAPPRDDVLLSRWFAGESPDPGADEVWQRVSENAAHRLHVIEWNSDSDLQSKLRREVEACVRATVGDESISVEHAFELSLGGGLYNGQVYFNASSLEADGTVADRRAGSHAEDWQILSAIRGGEIGVDGLNRWIQKLFRTRARSWAEPEDPRRRKTAKPMGSNGILYGDKVINLSNGRRYEVYPELANAYLANGEIGMVVGQYKGKNARYAGLPWKLEVEFSTQLGFKFSFGGRDFGEDGNDRLELAYALTIHKSQGSEFGTTFVVIPNPCRPLSRELLYTALTRQRDRVVLFHQGDSRQLMRYSDDRYSDTARRLTNLFSDPEMVSVGDTFLEKGLIHRTVRGELVRSKSEVIVANVLHELGMQYAYEQAFVGADGSKRYPDFTIDDAEIGRRTLIEHLGMLIEPDYRRRWEHKLTWYRTQGVLPIEEGGGKMATLVTTDELGGIDAAAIKRKLSSALGV